MATAVAEGMVAEVAEMGERVVADWKGAEVERVVDLAGKAERASAVGGAGAAPVAARRRGTARPAGGRCSLRQGRPSHRNSCSGSPRARGRRRHQSSAPSHRSRC